MAKDKSRNFKQGQIEQIAKVLGKTDTGLKNSEIDFLLRSCKIEDIDPNNTKWKRIYNAFVEFHNKNKSDNFILSFISKSLEPSRYSGKIELYKSIISDLNVPLSFIGLEYREDGKFHEIPISKTLTEAEKRASKLQQIVVERNLHQALLKFCKRELLQENFFHAVLEAVKGIASLIREKTGLTTDGSKLVDSAFSGDMPLLIINSYHLESEISEQKGFTNLLKGLFGTFRNPIAHAPRIEWDMKEEDALDLFTMASYAYRRISEAQKSNFEDGNI